jgi:molybdopterin/thiamine biosynthesis adenylyltransferase
MKEMFMKTPWSFEKAFNRNFGLLNKSEQATLSASLVVIPGCGGIGSTVAETLTRLGVGRFRLCDSDSYDVANFNRQLGATLQSVGKNKAEATRERILSINPNAQVEIFPELVCPGNASDFVHDSQAVLDGIDFFAITGRRALFRAAHDAGIPAMTAAPLGFSASLQVYLPDRGLSFDQFFNFKPQDSYADQVTKFLIGLAPSGLHLDYMDMSVFDPVAQTGPSSIIGTQLAATLIAGELVRVLLNRGPSLPAPWYRQFDAYKQKWVCKRLKYGNAHPMQKMKFQLVKRSFKKTGVWDAFSKGAVAL